MPRTALTILALAALQGCAGVRETADQGTVGLDVSADGRKIVFSASMAAPPGLYELDLTTLAVRVWSATKTRVLWPRMAADGRTCICSEVTDDGARLVEVSSGTGQTRSVTTQSNVFDHLPVFLPGGREIVFVRSAGRRRGAGMGGLRWRDPGVWRTRLDGTDARRITDRSYYTVGEPAPIPWISAVAFFADPNLGTDDEGSWLCVVPLAPGRRASHTSGHGVVGSLAALRTTREIACALREGTSSGIVLMRIDGSRARVVHQDWGSLRDVRVTDRDAHIVCLRERGAPARCDVLDIDLRSGQSKVLAPSALFDDPLGWSSRAGWGSRAE